jgi:DNA repair exonuclease SbcCD ATPase subunit
MERLFLYVTLGMILLTCTTGCVYSPNHRLKREDPGLTAAREGLADADTAIAHGDFPLALKKNEETLTHYPGILEDQALYQRGLIHAHPRNPEQNFTAAIDIFWELKEKFPGGRLEIEAEAWMITLENIHQKDQALSALRKDIQKREKTIAQLNTKTGTRQGMIKQLNNQIPQLESQISQLENQVLQLESQISQLESQLEKLKKVDLGIEEKKRTGIEH